MWKPFSISVPQINLRLHKFKNCHSIWTFIYFQISAKFQLGPLEPKVALDKDPL